MGNQNATSNSTLFDELDELEAGFFFLEAVMFVPIVFGNALILVSIKKFRWLQSPLNSVIGNLAVGDLLIGILLIPFDIIGTFFGLNQLRYVCLSQWTIFVSLLLVSLLNMLAISAERYFSVAFPWQHRRSKRHKYVQIFIPFCWILSIGFSVIPLFGLNDFTDGKSRCHLANVWPRDFRTVLSTIVLIIIIVKTVLFSLVVKAAIDRRPKCTGQEEDIRIRRQLRKIYILILISAIFIVCWAPYCIIIFFEIFIDAEELKVAQGWTLLLGLFNSGLNWLIYGFSNAKIRQAFKLLLCSKRKNLNSLEMES